MPQCIWHSCPYALRMPFTDASPIKLPAPERVGYFSFQMSRLYSAIVRSLEKNPAFAMLTRLI